MIRILLGFTMTEEENDAWLFADRHAPAVKTGVAYVVQLVDTWDKESGWPEYDGPDRDRAITIAKSKRWDCVGTSDIVTLDRYENGVLKETIEF